MKRRLGEDLARASEERVHLAKRDTKIERPRPSGLSDFDIMLRNAARKRARESGDRNAIRMSFGAPPLGRNSLMALGLMKAQKPDE